MTSTVLVGTDGSQAASAVERIGAEFATHLKARLLGVSIIEDRFARGMPEDGLGVTPPSPDAMASYLKSRAEAACRRLAERARTAGVEHTTEVLPGIADDRLVERGQTADFIIVGRDGQHAASHTGLIGSTANGVIRKTAKSVMLVPSGAQLSGPILLAFDGSAGSRVGAALAVRIATHLGEPIHVFVDSKDKGRAIARFDEVRGLVGALPVPVREISSTLGRPDVKVVDSAREIRAGLIVMGAYGRNRITEYFLGSNSAAVARTSPIAVLLAR
jgi:nucleotide-binding universal stress UspA family protein